MKILIIGSGMVGSQTALLLLLEDITDTVYLYDKNTDKARGESMDINQCMSVMNNEKECIAISNVQSSDIIIVAIGRRRVPGEIRADLFKDNQHDVIDVCRLIQLQAPKAVILMATNPSDDFTRLAKELTSCEVHSIGTDLDTARLRELIHSKTDVPRKDITAYVSGEHSENMVVHDTDKATAEQCIQIAINTISLKGATVFAPSMTIVNKVRSIIEQN